MEQFFHSDNKDGRDLKLPALRNSKPCTKPVNNHVTIRNESTPELIENGISNLCIDKTGYKNQSERKASAPVLSNQMRITKKHIKPSVNACILRKSCRQKSQPQNKNENKQMLKPRLDIEVSHTNINDSSINETRSLSKSQGVQTVDVNDIDSLYSEGIIRYVFF